MKIDIMAAVTDAAIVVAGGSLLDTYVISKVAMIADLVNKIPDVMGISLKAIVLGAAVLVAVKALMKK